MKSALQTLRELRDETSTRREPEDFVGEILEAAPVLEARSEQVAWLLYSKLLERDLWLCCDDQAAAEIAAEGTGVPVLTFDEVPLLRGKPVELLRAVLDAKAEFVGARLQA